MTDAQSSTLVLKDPTGNYFLVEMETVEQGRVPAEHTAELEQAIAAAQGGSDGEVQGFLHPFLFAAAGVLTAVTAVEQARQLKGQK